jgi:fatty-acid peroxygenase
MAKPIPAHPTLEGTVAFRADPYRFISRRCRELGSDVFQTRLFLRPTICMRGPSAARVFYDPQRFRRAGHSSEGFRTMLFGRGGVQGLDGDLHRRRKQLVMSLMTPDRIRHLTECMHREMRLRAAQWAMASQLSVYAEFLPILVRGACVWPVCPSRSPTSRGICATS